MRQGIRLGRSVSDDGDSTATHVAAPAPFALLRALLRTLLLLLLVISGVYWLICAFGAITAHDLGNDFLVYFSAALALRDNPHATIFDLHTLQMAAAAHGAPTPTLLYLYPPLLAILLIPLTLVPYPVALFLWTLLNLALWAYGTAMLVQWAWALLGVAPSASIGESKTTEHAAQAHQRARKDLALFASTVTVLLSASFFPLLYGVINGQVTSLIFMLSLLALAVLPRYPRLAGAALALAAWIKLFPIVLVGYFLLRRRWRVVEGAALAAALLAVFTLLVVGWQGLLATTSIFANGSAMANVQHANWNLTLAQVPHWIALAQGGEPGNSLALLGTAISASVGVLFAAGVFLRPRNASSREPLANVEHSTVGEASHAHLVDLLGFSWGLCTMVLLSPVTWMHTFAWLLPPSVICLSVALRALIEKPPAVPMNRPHTALLTLILLLMAYASLAVPAYTRPMPSISSLLHGQPLNLLLLLLHPVGALLLWVVNGLLFSRAIRSSARHEPLLVVAQRDKGVENVAGESAPAMPSAHFLALALMAMFFVVGTVEMVYWSVFLIAFAR